MEDFLLIWSSALALLKQEISAIAYDTWLAPIQPVDLKGNILTLSVPSSVNKNMLLTKYFSLIESCLETVSGRGFDIEVTVKDDEVTDGKGNIVAEGTDHFNSRYTFETFIVGNNNNLAHAASLAVAENPGGVYNPLFLYGGSGLGKTHLLNAIGHYVSQTQPDLKVMYTTSEKFTNDLVAAIKRGANQQFRDKYRQVDMLLIDDIQFISGREGTQEEFFHTFNALYERGKQIILTCDRLPGEIPQLEDRLRTRFQMGLLADVQPPDYETRIAILLEKMRSEYLSVDESIVKFVAEGIKSNVRDLEGAVKRMMAYTGIERTNRVTMELAQRALKDILEYAPIKEITLPMIVDEAERYYGLPRNALLSKNRSRELSLPRQVVMYIAREKRDMSLPDIGKGLGGRDHTTVMHGVGKIKNDMLRDEFLAKAIRDIIVNLEKN